MADNFLRVPGNQASVFLDKAKVAMDYLGRLWELSMDHDINVEGSDLCSSTEIRIRCINSILSCYLVWLSGGAHWVAAALDYDLILMVAKTCHFLDGVRDSNLGCETATRAAVITLRELVQSVHRYKAYHAVSRCVNGNLAWTGRDYIAFQAAWDELKHGFYVTDAFNKAIQCANTTTEILSVRAPRVCSRCLTFAYGGVECQRQHYEATHQRECRGIASIINVALQIARDHGNLSDTVSRAKHDISVPLVVIFDLSKPTLGEYEIMSREDALEDEEMVDKERMKLTIMDTNVFFCGHVPLFGDSSTLVVCMERQLVRDGVPEATLRLERVILASESLHMLSVQSNLRVLRILNVFSTQMNPGYLLVIGASGLIALAGNKFLIDQLYQTRIIAALRVTNGAFIFQLCRRCLCADGNCATSGFESTKSLYRINQDHYVSTFDNYAFDPISSGIALPGPELRIQGPIYVPPSKACAKKSKMITRG
ncbi:hypothetical protein BT96DRAFT_948997 [Gymnopus androsaceus JB14]|uniref:Uncharacterized protein n=1 Tax=Gymnopus androsaceus JB14 TaxID=1447944 RepID=A0A6A4GM84_9AGAR|nr:hypothetical protein BT96DRAFT_948997 [Gymnopus androsaceus JB14]